VDEVTGYDAGRFFRDPIKDNKGGIESPLALRFIFIGYLVGDWIAYYGKWVHLRVATPYSERLSGAGPRQAALAGSRTAIWRDYSILYIKGSF
jgi:hypothetical protein